MQKIFFFEYDSIIYVQKTNFKRVVNYSYECLKLRSVKWSGACCRGINLKCLSTILYTLLCLSFKHLKTRLINPTGEKYKFFFFKNIFRIILCLPSRETLCILCLIYWRIKLGRTFGSMQHNIITISRRMS